jgi:cell wall-associated NlpC family hydrolase
MYVYAQLGVSLPHNAAAQYSVLPKVPLSDLEPGDLVFFNGLGHVGIYVGNGMMIHAPHTGTVVQFGSINDEGSISGAARVPG